MTQVIKIEYDESNLDKGDVYLWDKKLGEEWNHPMDCIESAKRKAIRKSGVAMCSSSVDEYIVAYEKRKEYILEIMEKGHRVDELNDFDAQVCCLEIVWIFEHEDKYYEISCDISSDYGEWNLDNIKRQNLSICEVKKIEKEITYTEVTWEEI
jgi:hypothetical protein